MDNQMLSKEAIQARIKIISLLKLATKETKELNLQIRRMINSLHEKSARKAA